jgi:hypothetical protein
MDIVSFETAKALAAAKFPQPGPSKLQAWYDERGEPYVVVGTDGPFGVDVVFLGERDYAPHVVDCALYDHIFAPTATDIMLELSPDHELYYSHSTEVWVCRCTHPASLSRSEHKIPAEACAAEQLKHNKP